MAGRSTTSLEKTRSGGRARLLRLLVIVAVVAVAAATIELPVRAVGRVSGSVSRELRVRKSVTDLSPAERAQYVAAVLKLKHTPSPYDERLSYYDQFVFWHKEMYRCSLHHDHAAGDHHLTSVHAGPMFLPWHREFVLRFETALREVSGTDVTVPYWDWADGKGVEEVFAADFMGPTGNEHRNFIVESGPFGEKSWKLKVHPEGAVWAPSATSALTRRIGHWVVAGAKLPSSAQLEAVMAAPMYDVPPYHSDSDLTKSFRNALEGFEGPPPNAPKELTSPSRMQCGPDGWMNTFGGNRIHGAVHTFVGGSLTEQSRPTLGADASAEVGPDGATVAIQPQARAPLFGTMVLPTSPNDPVFFLHHANIDRLWAEWQAAHPTETYRPESGLDVVMEPFYVTPRDMLDIAKLRYAYR